MKLEKMMNINAKNNSLFNLNLEFIKKNNETFPLISNKNSKKMTADEKQIYTTKISEKLANGKKLSPKDMEHLRQNNPNLYEKALKIKAERQLIKMQFAGCKSKKEVQDLYELKSMQFLNEYKSIENAAISAEEREESIAVWNMRYKAFNDEMQDFSESDEYKNLPKKSEKDKNKKDKITLQSQNFDSEQVNDYTVIKNYTVIENNLTVTQNDDFLQKSKLKDTYF